MSKKSKRPRTDGAKAPPVSQPGPDAQPPAVPPEVSKGLLLTDLKALADQHVANKDWEGLVQLGRTAPADICEPDRAEADTWLLRVRSFALWPNDTLQIYDLPRDRRAELNETLTQLADRVDALHREPVFDLYLSTRAYSIEDQVQAFRQLTRACLDVCNLRWVRKLRDIALWLSTPGESLPSDLTGPQQELLASLPDIYVVLSEVYAFAGNGSLNEEDLLLLKVLKIDLDMRMADPWDYARVTESGARLRSPSVQQVAAVQKTEGYVRQQLTPKDWCFLWELEHTRGDGLQEMLDRYAGDFVCDGCEGLRLVAQSLVADSSAVDQLISRAVQVLMRFHDGSPNRFGCLLAVATTDQHIEIDVGSHPLQVPAVEDLLLRLLEEMPKNHSRWNEVHSLYRIFSAAQSYQALQDEDEAGLDMPGLVWLCEQSLSFQFAAACVVDSLGGRICLFLDWLRRLLAEKHPVPRVHYWGTFGEGELEPAQARTALELMSKLVPLRELMDDHIRSVWLDEVGKIFGGLSGVEGVRSDTLELAREFSEDLLAKGESFRLGYLEQVAGDAKVALDHYLANIDTSKELLDAAVNNAKILWLRSNELQQVQSMVDRLEDAVKTSSRPTVVQQLLADARACLGALNKKTQFEQTAVNRWPSITEPARKLLGVFSTIQRYSSFRELAEYAGMREDWAKRHYDKLVETGMLIVSSDGYHINPYIVPHLERESQHAVVGRIVRSQGTSAVKQVFNSQREFTIYQVLVQLCPNHLVFPNSSLQSIMNYDRMKELVTDDDFGYYLRASVDIVVVSSTTYLPMLAIEVDSVWHDTERQQKNDGKKDRIFAAGGVPFMRLRPLGSPSENTIRAQVAEHVDDLVRTLRLDMPGYDQARGLLEDLSGLKS